MIHTATESDAALIKEMQDEPLQPYWIDRARLFHARALWSYLGVRNVTNWKWYGNQYELGFDHPAPGHARNYILFNIEDIYNGGERLADKLELTNRNRNTFMDQQDKWSFWRSLLHAAAKEEEVI